MSYAITDPQPVIFPGVQLGEGTVVEPGARIGVPPRGAEPGERPTVIGPNCRIRSGTVIYAGAVLGANVQTGHSAMIREDNVIGDRCSVGTFAVLEPGNRIGEGTRVHSHCFLENVTLGRRFFLGPGVVFTDDPHPPCPRYDECVGGATVEDDASIGGNATILPGVRIGARSLVGAGSVVTRDVEPDTVVAGSPARAVRKVAELICHAGHFPKPYAWREALDQGSNL